MPSGRRLKDLAARKYHSLDINTEDETMKTTCKTFTRDDGTFEVSDALDHAAALRRQAVNISLRGAIGRLVAWFAGIPAQFLAKRQHS